MKQLQILKAIVLGISGSIAAKIIGFLIYLIGVVFDVNSLRSGFVLELIQLTDYPLFFIFGGIINILIGGEIIYLITQFISKILGIKILAVKRKTRNK